MKAKKGYLILLMISLIIISGIGYGQDYTYEYKFAERAEYKFAVELKNPKAQIEYLEKCEILILELRIRMEPVGDGYYISYLEDGFDQNRKVTLIVSGERIKTKFIKIKLKSLTGSKQVFPVQLKKYKEGKYFN